MRKQANTVWWLKKHLLNLKVKVVPAHILAIAIEKKDLLWVSDIYPSILFIRLLPI